VFPGIGSPNANQAEISDGKLGSNRTAALAQLPDCFAAMRTSKRTLVTRPSPARRHRRHRSRVAFPLSALRAPEALHHIDESCIPSGNRG
jgi:hypothetical protein